MAERIDPALATKLDAFTVPALPQDFADRMVAAALAEGNIEASQPAPLPPLRRSPRRRWLRAGATGLGAIAVGMISISAAAMGYFGEPIRHAVQHAPVVGKVIERVLPKSFHHATHVVRPVSAHPVKPIAPPVHLAPSVPAMIDAAPPIALTPFERRARLRAIMADPQSRREWMLAHPRAAERMRERRFERLGAPRVEQQIERRRMRLERGLPPGPPPRLRALERAERNQAWREGEGPFVRPGPFAGRRPFAERRAFAERRPFAERRAFVQRRAFAEHRRMRGERMGHPGRFRRF